MFPELNWPHFKPMFSEGQLRELLDSLETPGIYINEHFIDLKYTQELKAFAQNNLAEDQFRSAKIGQTGHANDNPTIRSDQILWVSEFSGHLNLVGLWLNELSTEIKNFFRVSIKDIESHFSIYPAGSRYAKHCDCGPNDSARLFTFIFYLNSEWTPDDGGELIIYNPTNPTEVIYKIAPNSGTFVIFRSDLFFHEVLISKKPRYTFTGWLRRDARI